MAAEGARDQSHIEFLEISSDGNEVTDPNRQAEKPEHDDTSFDYSKRTQWLRAAILGANDGLVSVASLMMGVGAVKQDVKGMLLPAVAGLVAGACSMALGEFVSVYAQYHTEMSQMKREMMEKNGGDEKTIDEQAVKKKNRLPSPVKAAIASAISFSIGAVVPLLGAVFIKEYKVRMAVVSVLASVGLVVLGGVGATLGGAPVMRSCARVFLGGWMAMAITYGLTKLICSSTTSTYY
ncbi:hypothetical protein ACLB2K_057264 [Fragaria x ananassa]|uniref:vacuolar iron transporter homolog 4-like n=1 Tax=Fragaria vesca subsp. vesca TaxID=101020 RepID=UPI0005CAB71C|nr:PREDICTED: vacuolar iron transporter homolog 4-like [Fragaria vesca subsp. vesca]